MGKKINTNREYLRYAELAVKFEQDKQYSEASICWADAAASLIGTQSPNFDWAVNRAEFCQYWATRDITLKELSNEK